MEEQGHMAAADYLRWEAVGDKVSRQGRIEDEDLDWAISTMQKPSTNPSELHSTIISLFLAPRTLTPSQKQKIHDAVLPLLSSKDEDDRMLSRMAIRKVSK